MNGDAMLVDRNVERIVGDAFYVLGHDDQLFVKAIEQKLNGDILLKPRNPAYREETLERGEDVWFQVFGRVVWRGGLV